MKKGPTPELCPRPRAALIQPSPKPNPKLTPKPYPNFTHKPNPNLTPKPNPNLRLGLGLGVGCDAADYSNELTLSHSF